MKKGLLIGIIVVFVLLVIGAVVLVMSTSGETTDPPAGDDSKFNTTLKGWQPIAQDGGMFELTAPATIRWGADTRMVDMDLGAGVYICGVDNVFKAKGDPAYGTVKQCFIDGSKTASLGFATMGPYAGSWTPIADSPNGIINTKGSVNVRFGAGNAYFQKNLNGTVTCNPTTFGGDPVYGVAKKCYVEDPNEVM